MTLVSKTAGISLVGLAATAMTAPSFAQDAPAAVNTGALSWAAGADVVSTYVFRGIEQEDTGLIVQPYVEVGTTLGDSGVDFTIGTWNSLHSEGTGATNPNTATNWYESDLYATLGTAINDQIYVSGTFTGYYYPNGSATDIEELSFALEYDDSEVLGDWSVAPYVLIAFETRDKGGTEDIYLELGGELGAPFIESEDLPIDLSFPFAIGLSIDDYYTDAGGSDETFGFLMIGVAASMPLDFIPADYGTWTATAGLDLFFLNDDVAVGTGGLNDNGDDFNIVGKVGVGLEY